MLSRHDSHEGAACLLVLSFGPVSLTPCET